MGKREHWIGNQNLLKPSIGVSELVSGEKLAQFKLIQFSQSITAMSENYVVFIEQPIKMDLLKIVTGKLRGKSISDGFLWDPKLNTIFHLIHKQTGEVKL